MKTYLVIHTDNTYSVMQDAGTFREIREAISAEWITYVPSRNENITIYGDDESLLNGSLLNIPANVITDFIHPLGIHGDIAIFGKVDEEGDELSIPDAEMVRLIDLVGAVPRT